MLASEISRSPKLDELIRTRGSTSLGDFVKFLQESPVGDIETFLAGRRAVGPAELAELVAVELRHRLTLKQPYRIEHFLRRFPDLGADREQVLDLIYAEFCERRRHDAKTDSQEYYERFPSLRDSLERMFRMDGLFQGGLLSGNPSESDHEAMPNEGDRFLDFQLKVTLGRGSFGVVFLAEQETLE